MIKCSQRTASVDARVNHQLYHIAHEIGFPLQDHVESKTLNQHFKQDCSGEDVFKIGLLLMCWNLSNAHYMC